MEIRTVLLYVSLVAATVPSQAQETVLTLGSFTAVQTATSVQVNLTLDRDVIGTSGCFFDKLTFVGTGSGFTGFTPMYPGQCDFPSESRNTLSGTMDVRDFSQALQFELLRAIDSTNILIRGQSSVSLIPGVLVRPTTAPIGASMFSRFMGRPSLISFDFDFSARQILLHFDGLIDTSNVNINRLTLSSDETPANGATLATIAVQPGRYVTTLCVRLTAVESINTCDRTCFCSFPPEFASDYNGIAIMPAHSLPVTVVRSSSSNLPVFMRLSLEYVGCSGIYPHNLAQDEVFVIRPNEYVTRIECFTDNTANSSNVRPQITRENSFSSNSNATIDDNIVYNWPLTVYLNFSDALPPELYGQYVCRSSVGYYIRTYVHNNNFNIELPDGSNYRIPVYDPLTIPLYFGSYPHIDLTQNSTGLVLYNTNTEAGVPTTPERVNPYHAIIKYYMTEQLVSGNYEIRIIRGTNMLARQPITIQVTDPVLTLEPEVATYLPDQEEIILSCTTNSDRLSVRWYSGDSGEILGFNTTYRVQLPSTASYNCSAMDADTIITSAVVPVVLVQEILSVWRDGSQIENNSLIVENRGNLNLQCIEHVGVTATNLTWFVLPENDSLFAPSVGKEGDTYRATASSNQATLTIVNSIDEPFRGLLKCWSTSGLVVNIKVVDSEVEVRMCQEENTGDSSLSSEGSQICQERPAWAIQWAETIAGSRDFQPCPEANGFVLRYCNEDGTWNNTIDISNCESDNFSDLRNLAEDMVFRLKDAYNDSELHDAVTQLIRVFNDIIQPKVTTHFPRDLTVAADVLESLVDLLSKESLVPAPTELVSVLDGLFHANNIEGWQLLTLSDANGQHLLNVAEDFGLYLLQSLSGGEQITVQGSDIAFSAISINEYDQDIVYPADLTRGAQITLPSSVLNEVRPNGSVHIIMNNLNCFLPKPSSTSTSNSSCVASSVLSTLITTSSGVVTQLGNNQNIAVLFLTKEVTRAVNPVCLFWDDTSSPQGGWSQMGINTDLLDVTSGEVKQFKVNCSTNRLAAFGVEVSMDDSEFSFTVPVYVGCGLVIFSSVLSVFCLLLSCMCDSLRRHSFVAFLIHLSFITSLFCAYVAFVAGIEQASNHRIGCVAVAGLLHYFFTAAFTWLMLEGLLLVYFKTFSKHCGLLVVVFLVGWGVPAIPTAISLGILHESYGTTQNCWIFFDGMVSDEVVLGFLIPKLIIIAATIVLLLIGCCTNYKFGNRKIQPYLKTNVSRILWMIWGSVCLFLIFLSASWVFALLLVNVYRIDSAVLGWVFMIASILLGVWIFIFSVALMVINQKVDYDRLWSVPDPVYLSSDPGRGKGYQFMNMPEVDLSGRRTSTLTRPPTILSNPAFGMEKH